MTTATETPKKTSQKSLQPLLASPKPIVLAGAHDALSARIVERAGFDAVWVSSFCLSASLKAVPDTNILTMTESLEVARSINDAVNIPVIADCDNGYGNAINVIRTVTEFSNAGIAGISIEDATFPKRCSLYPGEHKLVSIEEMAGRIRAGKDAATNPDFVLIARTEALIAGLGLEEAFRRADAYKEAGADAILIHSKAGTSSEVLAFAEQWQGGIPLVVVPTMFPESSVDDLTDAGFKIIIFANHALRAAVTAMKTQMDRLFKEKRAAALNDAIAPLQEVYDLVGVPTLQEQEDKFLPARKEPVKAIILAAGYEEQLLPDEDKPKAMLDIKGKSILERQVDLLKTLGILDITIVRGHKSEAIDIPQVKFAENANYKETGIAASLFSASDALEGRTLVLYADILFDPAILENLLESEGDVTLAVDRAWLDTYQTTQESPEGTDLVQTQETAETGTRFVPTKTLKPIIKVGQQLDQSTATGEFIGLALFSAAGTEALKQAYQAGENNSGAYQEADSFAKASLTDLLQNLIDSGVTVNAIESYKGWMEIDTFEDYKSAWAKLN